MPLPSPVLDDAAALAIELRRELHRHPEPGHGEHRTTSLIASALTGEGLRPTMRPGGTGLWVDIGGPPRVGFRADLDALPIEEPTGNDPRSLNQGWMHACGHDAHAAIAFGIAVALSRLGPSGVRVVFQPAEESFPGGAAALANEGVVDGLQALLAFHVDPGLPTGVVGGRPGPITAGADQFVIDLVGPGGHTARPRQTVDLIGEAGRIISELPVALTRWADPRGPLVVAFGAIHGGEAANVIPAGLELKGTVRVLDRVLWEDLPDAFAGILAGILAPPGAAHRLRYTRAVPPVVNDPGIVEKASAAIAAALGPGGLVTATPSMGGEDFANYLDIVPGALFRLGTSGSAGDLHSPRFRFDDDAVPVGIRAGVAALSALL